MPNAHDAPVFFYILSKSDLLHATAKMINIFFIPPARISKCALDHREFIVLFPLPPVLNFYMLVNYIKYLH